MNLQPFSWLILAFIGIILLALAYAIFSASLQKSSMKKNPKTGKRGDSGICPVVWLNTKKG